MASVRVFVSTDIYIPDLEEKNIKEAWDSLRHNEYETIILEGITDYVLTHRCEVIREIIF